MLSPLEYLRYPVIVAPALLCSSIAWSILLALAFGVLNILIHLILMIVGVISVEEFDDVFRVIWFVRKLLGFGAFIFVSSCSIELLISV